MTPEELRALPPLPEGAEVWRGFDADGDACAVSLRNGKPLAWWGEADEGWERALVSAVYIFAAWALHERAVAQAERALRHATIRKWVAREATQTATRDDWEERAAVLANSEDDQRAAADNLRAFGVDT